MWLLRSLPSSFRASRLRHRLLGRDHGRAGQAGLVHDLAQADVAHHRHEQKQAAHPRVERAWAEAQRANIGDGGRLRSQGRGAFVVAASGQAGKAFLTQQEGECVNAGTVPGLGQFALDVIDGEVAFAHAHHQGADAITYGRGGRALGEGGEEAGAEVRVVAELVTQDAERTGGIAEAAGDVRRGKLLNKEGAEGLVLPLQRGLGGKEELSVGARC